MAGPGGRPVGSKNTKTKQWRNLSKMMLQTGALRLRKIMTEMNDEDFVETYLKLLQYFKPKIQSTKIASKGKIAIQIISEDTDILDKV